MILHEDAFLLITVVATDTNAADELIDVAMMFLSLFLSLYIPSTKRDGPIHHQSSAPAPRGHSRWTQWERGNHMSDDFMVDDFNIRHSSQRGYTLESLNSQ